MEALAGYESNDSTECSEDNPLESHVACKDVKLNVPPAFCTDGARSPQLGLAALSAERLVLVHVFIPVLGRDVNSFTRRLMGLARLQLVGEKTKASFSQQDSLHISLARPVAIPESETSNVVNSLRRNLTGQKGGSVFVEERVIALLSKSTKRLFVAAPVAQVSSERVLIPLVQRVDHAYSGHKLPIFFEEPLLHMSFASTETTAVQAYFTDQMKTPSSTNGGLEVDVGVVICEVGQRQFVMSLARNSRT